jgi:hypothetical protein
MGIMGAAGLNDLALMMPKRLLVEIQRVFGPASKNHQWTNRNERRLLEIKKSQNMF